MTSLRLQNDPSFDEEQLDQSDSDVESMIGRRASKGSGKVGRPRGKGRPKRSTKMMGKKNSQDEEQWQEKIYARERQAPAKEQTSVEGYIKIIDYLKKIDYDQQSLQNKMNPFNALTATCFWYAISAEFFSHDFFAKRNPHDLAMELLQKVQKLSLPLPNRVMKVISNPPLLDYENEELHKIGIELGQKMSNLIPAPLAYRSQIVQRKIPTSSTAQDDLFISSTRALLYNYISKKVKTSEKWATLVNSYEKQIHQIPLKEFSRPPQVQFVKEEEPVPEINLFELLREKAKKKVQKRQKNKSGKKSKESDIYHEESAKQEEENQHNEVKEEQEVEEQNVMKEEKNEMKSEREMKEENPNQAPQEAEANEKIQGSEEKISQQHKEEIQQKQFFKKYRQQDAILNSIQHMSIDKAISILQSSLPSIELPEIKPSLMPIPTKDPLDFVFQLHTEEEKYLEYMKDQRKKKYRAKAAKGDIYFEEDDKQGQYQDAKCQICTDGDYTDDNLIVFCSMCNISLHQRCVGLAKVPAESWVCEICQAFGPGGINLPCPLCDIKGGAMKRTSIHIDTNIFKESNPGYHEFAKRCPYNKQKEEYTSNKEKVEEKNDEKVEDKVEEKNEEKVEMKAEEKFKMKADQKNEEKVQMKAEQKNEDKMEEKVEEKIIAEGDIEKPVEERDEKEANEEKQEKGDEEEKGGQEEEKGMQEEEGEKGQKGEKNQVEVRIGNKQLEARPDNIKVDKEEEYYYDYFVKSTYPSDIPTCHYVWVHYVCAIWVPECYFEQKNGAINVRGIQNIDHKRFKNTCFVCKKNRCGAAVKCQDPECNKYYHPQCARKKKVYMEQLNLQKLKYLIFCQEHQPLKLTRQIEYKKKKGREEIIKFARMIEKYIETYRIAQFPFKLMKSAIPSNFIETTIHKHERQHKDRRAIVNANSDEQFLKDLISNLSKAKMMTVHLEKIDSGYKITSVETPSKRQIRKCLNRYDQFWNSIKNGDSNQENFKRYERIMLENQKLRQKLELFLNGNLSIRPKNEDKKEKKVGRKRGKNVTQKVETLVQEEGGIFCVCKKPYENETDMLQCQVCGEWYHFKCLDFIGTEADAQTMEFSCMKCMKFEQKTKKEERIAKYAGLFKPNSILYLYRPPTPDLLSQQEVQPKNYNQIMEEVKKNIEKIQSPKKQKLEHKKESIHSKDLSKKDSISHEKQPIVMNQEKMIDEKNEKVDKEEQNDGKVEEKNEDPENIAEVIKTAEKEEEKPSLLVPVISTKVDRKQQKMDVEQNEEDIENIQQE